MTKAFEVEPDLQFTKDLMAAGAGDLKKCYQCATCSVACPISPDNSPFPRKEMIWAQWGLKDRLMSDPDVWLCHQCNDCSTDCPRGANPGDVLKAVRKMTIQGLAWPSFMGKLVGEASLFVAAIAIPIVVVLALVFLNSGHPRGASVHYGEFIDYIHIQVVFTLALIFAVISMAMSLRKYWDILQKNTTFFQVKWPVKNFIPSLIDALKEILPHSKFKECKANSMRYTAHLLTFWGMIGLFVTTAIVAGMIDILHLAPPSRGGPLTVPIKILGNVSAIAFVLGLGIMLLRRITQPEEVGSSSYFDWFFLLVILGTGVTGLLTELSRYGGSMSWAYNFYAIHLMFVLALLLYLPFSKFAHLGYRTLAIAWGKTVTRDKEVALQGKYVPPAPAPADQ